MYSIPNNDMNNNHHTTYLCGGYAILSGTCPFMIQ